MVMYNADEIRKIRLALNLNPTGFAALLGVSESAVCLWEGGKRHPRWETLMKLNELAKKNGVAVPA